MRKQREKIAKICMLIKIGLENLMFNINVTTQAWPKCVACIKVELCISVLRDGPIIKVLNLFLMGFCFVVINCIRFQYDGNRTL